MTRSAASPGKRLLDLWSRLHRLPGGRWAFNVVLGRMVPYTGELGASIVHLEPGHVRARLPDRRKVRNHLRSVHAVALVNLGEVTGGLALLTALAPGVRGIVTGLDAVYLKKARGLLVAECRCAAPEVLASMDVSVTTDISDAEGDVVSRVTVRWRLAPP